MNAIISLGKFERIEPITKAWPTEDGNFTPWLAESSAIKLLGDALGLELSVEATEYKVGAFRADILARADDEPAHRVVIENQFGGTDHGHLGQILTYLAGIEDAKTVVWIAEKIHSDHRAAVDWLNTNTGDEFSFFAIEIELWRINDSPPAPRFNVVASPNDWTRSTRQATGVLSVSGNIRVAYWSAFAQFLKEKQSTFRMARTNKETWFTFAMGRSGFHINAIVNIEKQRVGVELYTGVDPSKTGFRALLADKEIIEREFGAPLEWQELPGKKAWRIAIYRNDVDPADSSQYGSLHAWTLDKMERFRKVFTARVRALSLPDGLGMAEAGEPAQ